MCCSFLVVFSCGSNKVKPKVESKTINKSQPFKQVKDSSIHAKSKDSIQYKKLKSL